MSQTPADRLKALGLTLPDAPAPVANYVPYLIAGDLLFVSGQISKAPDGAIVAGRLGADITVEQGQKAARYCALNILAQANAALGSLDRIAQVMQTVEEGNQVVSCAGELLGGGNLVGDIVDAGRGG